MQPGDLGHDLQRVEDAPVGRRHLRPGGRPVDGIAVGHGLGQPGEIDGIHRPHCMSATRPTAGPPARTFRYSDSVQPLRYSRRRKSFAFSELVIRVLAAS